MSRDRPHGLPARGRRVALPAPLALAAAVTIVTWGGCAAPDPLDLWQRQVELLVDEVGGGDPRVLRRLMRARSRHVERPALMTTGALDLPGPPFGGPRDVQGVLLGARRFGGRDWYLFLVAVIERSPRADRPRPAWEAITDVRPVAMSVDGQRPRWRVGAAEPASLERYREARRGPPGVDSPRCAFPGPADRFEVTLGAGHMAVREEASGAAWRLRFADSSVLE